MIAELRVFREPEADNPQVHRVIFEPRLSIARERVDAFSTAASQRLSELFGREIRTRSSDPKHGVIDFEPQIIRGSVAFVVECAERHVLLLLSQEHARRLAAYAFSEKAQTPRQGGLSVIEERLVERVMRELATFCAPFAGSVHEFRVATTEDVAACTTHFILKLGAPVDVALLVGLTELEETPSGPSLSPQTLLDVEVTGRVEFASATLTAAQIAELRVGSVVELHTTLDDPAFLRVDGITVASGSCGICEGKPSFYVQHPLLMLRP